MESGGRSASSNGCVAGKEYGQVGYVGDNLGRSGSWLQIPSGVVYGMKGRFGKIGGPASD